MTKWVRATVDTICGRCGGHVGRGEPVLLIELAGLKAARRKVRCAKCDGPAPPDLPPLIERTPEPGRVFSKLGQLLPLDWKTRGAGGDREPGQEG